MRILVALFLIALPLSGQVRESIEVNVLELDVVVLDRGGNPVDGLTAADFDVQIGGKGTAVTNFYAVKRGAIVDESAQPRQRMANETMISTTVVIFIDDTRLGHRAKLRSIEALKEYLATNLGPATSAMIVRFNGTLDVRSRPSDRAGPLIGILDQLAKEPALMDDSDRKFVLKTIDESLLLISGSEKAHRIQQAWQQMIAYADRQMRETEQTLDALREVTKLTSAFEGRKSLLYISEGLPLQPAADIFAYWERATRAQGTQPIVAHALDKIARPMYNSMDAMRYDRSRQYAELSRQAQKANVHFFAIDVGGVRGFETGSIDMIDRVADVNTTLMRANLQDGVRMVANETGGRFIANENDLGRALHVVSEQFTTYYSLGVRAPSATRLTRVRVAVKNRPDLRVVSARHRGPLTRQEEMERAVRSRLYLQRDENPHGVQISAGTAANVNGRCTVPLNVSVPRAKIIPVSGGQSIDLHFALLDELYQESDVRTTAVPLGPGDVSHLLTLALKPGKYTLSLAVTDPSGETSYVQRAIDASTCR